VFTASTASERSNLGQRVTGWLEAHASVIVTDAVTVQSSNAAWHCVTIVLFYREGT
jgi:hypothetical protein